MWITSFWTVYVIKWNIFGHYLTLTKETQVVNISSTRLWKTILILHNVIISSTRRWKAISMRSWSTQTFYFSTRRWKAIIMKSWITQTYNFISYTRRWKAIIMTSGITETWIMNTEMKESEKWIKKLWIMKFVTYFIMSRETQPRTNLEHKHSHKHMHTHTYT